MDEVIVDIEKFFLALPVTRRIIKRNGKTENLIAYPTSINGLSIDWRGYPWVTWWAPDNESSTERERESRLFTSKDIRFRKYTHGIIEVERGHSHALRGGEEYATRVAEAQEFAGQFMHGLNDWASLDDRGEIGHLWRKLKAVKDRLEGMKSKPIVEALEKFEAVIIYRNADGKFNIGVFYCRLTAADARLFERLKVISIWSIDYYQRLLELRDLKGQFYGFLKDFKNWILADLSDKPRFVDSMGVSRYPEITENLKFWANIRPFRNWARLAGKDFESYRENLLAGKNQLAHWYLKRLRESIYLKDIQHDVYDLVDYLSNRSLRESKPGVWQYSNHTYYVLKKNVDQVFSQLKKLNDREWRFPVKEKLRERYLEFKQELKESGADFNKNRFTDEKQHKLVRDFLKDLSHMM